MTGMFTEFIHCLQAFLYGLHGFRCLAGRVLCPRCGILNGFLDILRHNGLILDIFRGTLCSAGDLANDLVDILR